MRAAVVAAAAALRQRTSARWMCYGYPLQRSLALSAAASRTGITAYPPAHTFLPAHAQAWAHRR